VSHFTCNEKKKKWKMLVMYVTLKLYKFGKYLDWTLWIVKMKIEVIAGRNKKIFRKCIGSITQEWRICFAWDKMNLHITFHKSAFPVLRIPQQTWTDFYLCNTQVKFIVSSTTWNHNFYQPPRFVFTLDLLIHVFHLAHLLARVLPIEGEMTQE
jgi:hypothetical protein